MTKQKKYWKGLAELANDPLVENLKHNEFAEEIPTEEFLGDEKHSQSRLPLEETFLSF